ncbi:MAG: repressor LexA [Candidatus Hydrogenedentes bacterium]|nr:repressor LexA [Candidatus Hydrogenedentota bacterium]
MQIMKRALTKRQREILNFIEKCIEQDGFPPTIAEIGLRFGIRSNNGVNDHLVALERKGYISRSSKARSIRVVHSHRAATRDFIGVPLVGRIAAGEPLLAVENIEGYVPVSSDAAPRPDFALKVTGESMIGEGILPGDTLLVRQQDTAEDGQLVVALVDDEAAVKRIYRNGNAVELRSANPDVPTMRVAPRRMSIQGVVVGLQRTIR